MALRSGFKRVLPTQNWDFIANPQSYLETLESKIFWPTQT